MVDFMEQRVGEAFTANTIMTPSEELMCWKRGTDLSAFCEKARDNRYDFAPVTEGDRIVGLLRVPDAQTEPLTDRWLVSHDTGIPHLLALFNDAECPCLLAFERQEVVGMVTPADLNKMSSRVYFYHLIGALEMALGALVQRRFKGQPCEILELLSEERQQKLVEEQEKLVRENVDIQIVERLYLSDLINIVSKREDLLQDLGFPSGKAAGRATSGLISFRDRIMHPIRPLIESLPDDLARLHRRAARARELLARVK